MTVKELCESKDGVVLFHDISVCAREALKADIMAAMKVFQCK